MPGFAHFESGIDLSQMPADILHVEDEPTFAQLLVRLSPKQFRLWTAATLAEAVEVLKDQKIKACILDLNLPDSCGIVTLRKLRECTTAPIIVVTGINDDQLAVKSFRFGAVGFYTKTDLVTPLGLAKMFSELDVQIMRYAQLSHPDTREIKRLSEEVYSRILTIAGHA